MSLINDALRKAHKAASEHAAQKPELPFRGMRVHPPRRSRPGFGLIVISLIAFAAGLTGATVAWWAADRQGEPEARAQVAPRAAAVEIENGRSDASPPPTPVSEEPEDSLAVTTDPILAPAGVQVIGTSEDPAPTQPETRTGAEPSSAPQTASAAETETSHSDPIGVGVDQATASDRETPGERVFVLDADLGYASLSLDFIVFRPDDPFAEINGAEVHEGWRVEGFVVEKIEHDRVRLRDENGPLVLRVP